MNRSHILPLAVIALITILALTNLETFPIFADEAIYLFWARKIMLGMEHPFMPLYDGKPPLFMWLAGLGSQFSDNLLLAGRAISVLCLSGILFGTYYVLSKSNRVWAWLSVLFIGLSPFVFFHSRLALLDPLFTLFLITAILVWTVLNNRWRGAATGILLGLAFWTKTPALFLLPLPFISALLTGRSKTTIKQALYAAGIAAIIIGSLRVSVWFPFLFNRAQDFAYPVSAILAGQTEQIVNNTVALIYWLATYRQWPVILAALLGLGLGIKRKNNIVLNLGLALLFFISPFILTGKVLAPRYFLFLGIGFPILACYFLSSLPRRLMVISSATLLLSFISYLFTLITQPLKTDLPLVDKDQYLQSWASGIGIREAAQFFVNQARTQKIKVLSEGYFGTLPDGLFVEIGNKMNDLPIEIVGVGDNISSNYDKELAKSIADLVYYIGNHDRIYLIDRPELELVLSYPKVDGGPALEVYKIHK